MSDEEPFDLHAEVDKIPGRDTEPWWHPHNGEAYHQLANELVAEGVDPPFAVDILSRAYGAAADEFGG